jgi:hypothetical protein
LWATTLQAQRVRWPSWPRRRDRRTASDRAGQPRREPAAARHARARRRPRLQEHRARARRRLPRRPDRRGDHQQHPDPDDDLTSPVSASPTATDAGIPPILRSPEHLRRKRRWKDGLGCQRQGLPKCPCGSFSDAALPNPAGPFPITGLSSDYAVDAMGRPGRILAWQAPQTTRVLRRCLAMIRIQSG